MKGPTRARFVAFALLDMRLVAVALTVVATVASAGVRAQTAFWPDTYATRLQALALIQTLRAEILATPSATATLEAWCRDHDLAPDHRIVARRLPGPGPAPTAGQRQRLETTAGDEIRYRRVQLLCGNRVLSHADNWYVPNRLSPDMNRLLMTTDQPFGRVIEPLKPYRVTLGATLLWSPLPADWSRDHERRPTVTGRAIDMPDALFSQSSLIYSRDRRPLAEVREIYQRDVLAFSPPSSR